MNCPVCKTRPLTDHQLESQLQSLHCQGCGGQWIKGFQYWKWLEQHGPNLPLREPEGAVASPPADSKPGKLCPECGRFLARHKVGHGVEFHLDRCAHCGGIWLDQNEWDGLKARNLHDDMHFIFSEAWQTQLRRQERSDYDRRMLVQNLGEETVRRLETTKHWLDSHEKRPVLYAYLLKKEL